MHRRKKQNPPKGNRSYKKYCEKYALIFLFLPFVAMFLTAIMATTIPENSFYIFFDKFVTIVLAPLSLFILSTIFSEIDRINNMYD